MGRGDAGFDSPCMYTYYMHNIICIIHNIWKKLAAFTICRQEGLNWNCVPSIEQPLRLKGIGASQKRRWLFGVLTSRYRVRRLFRRTCDSDEAMYTQTTHNNRSGSEAIRKQRVSVNVRRTGSSTGSWTKINRWIHGTNSRCHGAATTVICDEQLASGGQMHEAPRTNLWTSRMNFLPQWRNETIN